MDIINGMATQKLTAGFAEVIEIANGSIKILVAMIENLVLT